MSVAKTRHEYVYKSEVLSMHEWGAKAENIWRVSAIIVDVTIGVVRERRMRTEIICIERKQR